MSEAKHPSESITVEELFAEALLSLDKVVRNALRHYYPKHQADDVERFKQRLIEKLLKDDMKMLREFRQEAEPKTWLQQIANHEVIRVLREEGRSVSFDDAPPEVFIQPPTQEENLLHKEREQLMAEVLHTMTPHEQMLIELEGQGWKAEEIARELDIGVKTVYSKKSKAKRKLKELVEERQKIISKRE